MKDYRVVAPIVFVQGKLRLTDEQVANRMHCLKKVGKDTYEVLKESAFKAGEVVGLEVVSKVQESHLESLDVPLPDTKKPGRPSK